MLRRGVEVDIDSLVKEEGNHRALIQEVESLRAEQNVANIKIRDADKGSRADAIDEARRLSEELKSAEASLKERKAAIDSKLADLPNLVHPDAPLGFGDDSNTVLREVGEQITGGNDHLELGESLGVIDVERAAKVSGSRFGILRGEAALLELAMVRFTLDLLAGEGFVPVIPPVLVRESAMFGTGFFPTDEQQVYKTAADDLYLAGTSEVPLAAMHAAEVFDEKQLPVRYAGFSTCFRREAGTYGKDTRGIIRVHQFDKVEMFSFVPPASSDSEHAFLVELEERVFQALEIPYRVIEICAGDLAAPNYRKFDIEAWLPGSARWLEVTSCSNDIDYQSRRLSIRMKAKDANPFVHTLNGTGISVQRGIVALFENHQQKDGSVAIPDALRPFTGFSSIGPSSS